MIAQAQPYRRGARDQSLALAAMLSGRPMFLPNPQDLERLTMLLANSRRDQLRYPPARR